MWTEGQVVIRREVLNDGRVWLEVPVIVVRDDEELLATFIAEGAPFRFPAGTWPAPRGRHPWHGKERWHGHGVLMLQRPGEAHAVWLFWRGRARTFAGWYINIQEPFRRTTPATTRRAMTLRTSSSTSGFPSTARGSGRTKSCSPSASARAGSPRSRSSRSAPKASESPASSTLTDAGGTRRGPTGRPIRPGRRRRSADFVASWTAAFAPIERA